MQEDGRLCGKYGVLPGVRYPDAGTKRKREKERERVGGEDGGMSIPFVSQYRWDIEDEI
jgi:hypothetical protein